MLLNSRDIATLNRARAVLKRLEQDAWKRSLSHYDPFAPVTAWDLGRLSEAASAGDDAIFHVLATARASCNVKMTDAQLHGPAREDEPEGGSADGPPGNEEAPAAAGDATAAGPPGNATTDTASPRRPIHAV